MSTDDEREALASGLLEAMLGTDDGGFIDSDSEIPAGEMYRLALGFMRSRLSSQQGPITDEMVLAGAEALDPAAFEVPLRGYGEGAAAQARSWALQAARDVLEAAREVS